MSLPRRRAPLPTFILHWAFVAGLTVSFLTGMRIAADAQEPRLASQLASVLPQGNVMEWHALTAVVLAGVAAGYVVYLAASGLGRRLMPRRRWMRDLAAGPRPDRWKAVNLLLYWVSFILFLGALGTGASLYLDMAWPPAASVEAVHRWLAWGFAAFAVLHVAAQIALGGLPRLIAILLPRAALVGAGGLALGAGALAAAALVTSERAALPTLEVARLSGGPPSIDGRPDDRVWADAPKVIVHTANGANLAGGEAPVTVRAVHDGAEAYFLFEWPDANRSLKHAPLVKTERGWKVLQTSFGRADESVFYEDKFAVLISRGGGAGGDGSIHLGPLPLADHPGPSGGRGLHYTTDGRIIDLWHWKAVRSNPFRQADDNYFGPPEPMMPLSANERARKEAGGFPRVRYTGGYLKDPIGWDTYEMNWQAFKEDIVEPRRLPVDDDFLERLPPEPDLRPGVVDEGRWWIDYEDTDTYSSRRDHYPVGTVMPSVLLHAPLQGDRADVSAYGTWEQGVWRLEVRRRLDTGSEFDVPLEDGVHLWVAVFDRTQTRHSYHVRPLRVTLGK